MAKPDELTFRLERLWKGSRARDPKAIEELLRFIILEGPGSLRKYIPAGGASYAARPTEVLQRTAIKIYQKAAQGKLRKPIATALATLGSFVSRTAKEAIRFCKLTGGDLSAPQSISRSEWYLTIPDPSQPIPSREVPEANFWARRLERFRKELERLPEPDRSILRGLRDGKKLIRTQKREIKGLEEDLRRQKDQAGPTTAADSKVVARRATDWLWNLKGVMSKGTTAERRRVIDYFVAGEEPPPFRVKSRAEASFYENPAAPNGTFCMAPPMGFEPMSRP